MCMSIDSYRYRYLFFNRHLYLPKISIASVLPSIYSRSNDTHAHGPRGANIDMYAYVRVYTCICADTMMMTSM